MTVNCRTCKHYQRWVEVKYSTDKDLGHLDCLFCADNPDRKSFYEPIIRVPKDDRKEFYYGQLPGPGREKEDEEKYTPLSGVEPLPRE